MMKDPKEYSVEEVSIWLGVVGLGEFADNFRENSVNGGLLVTLEGNDLKELGLSGLQSKKLLRGLEQTKEMFEGGGGGADPAEIEALQKQVADLQRENAALKAELEKYKPKAAPAPAPAPAPASTHKTQHHDAPVLRGAAGGAARGVVLGAVAGAIAGDARKGVKIGAATGATAGAMRGMGARRRAHMMR